METHRLKQRPEAEARSVEVLMSRVLAGQVRVPHFQRPLKWKSQHVINLFDSIWRGFPIGELLLSKQPAEAEHLAFGPVRVHAEARSDALLVIDGQQRIVSLTGVLLHPEPAPRADIYAIWFDLEREVFQRRVEATAPAHWIPLNTVVDSAKLLRWLNDWSLRSERPDLLNRAIELGKAIREYQLPAYIVQGADDSTLRLIFSRVNTSGVAMTEGEVFDAVQGAPDRKPLSEAAARIEEEGFGAIDAKWLWRCLKAVEGLDPKLRAGDLKLGDSLAAVARTELAVRRTLTFLVSDAGILHRELLPYNLPLVILARFFHLHPSPSSRNRTLLVRWLWRGALSGEHSASSQAVVARLTSMIDDDEGETVQRLLRTVPLTWQALDPAEPAKTGAAKTKLLRLALLVMRPRDPLSGVALEPAHVLNVAEPSQLFVNVAAKPTIKSGPFTNFVVLTGDAVEQRKKRSALLASRDPGLLRSHAMTPEIAEALAAADHELYAKLRALTISAFAERFFRERAGSTESDRPAIEDIARRARAS